jgi:hypothetical protein
LLSLLFGITRSLLTCNSFEHHLETEDGTTLLVLLLLQHAELHTNTVLLRPLQELRLEVDLLKGHLVEVNILAKYLILEERQTSIVATIEIDGANKCLKGISFYITIMRSAMAS